MLDSPNRTGEPVAARHHGAPWGGERDAESISRVAANGLLGPTRNHPSQRASEPRRRSGTQPLG